jgi:hypothetical protein
MNASDLRYYSEMYISTRDLGRAPSRPTTRRAARREKGLGDRRFVDALRGGRWETQIPLHPRGVAHGGMILGPSPVDVVYLANQQFRGEDSWRLPEACWERNSGKSPKANHKTEPIPPTRHRTRLPCASKGAELTNPQYRVAVVMLAKI